MKHLSAESSLFLLSVNYDPSIIAWIKERFEKPKWDSSQKVWIINVKKLAELQSLKQFVDEIDDKAIKLMQEKEEYLSKSAQLEKSLYELSDAKCIDTVSNSKLLPFQEVALRYLEQCNGRALIADEMGLGKTVESLAWLANHREMFPVLVICPNTVKISWQRHIKEWVSEDSVQFNGKELDGEPGNFVVSSYDSLVDRNEEVFKKAFELVKYGFRSIILDEAHKIKNSAAKRSKAVRYLIKHLQIQYILALTGSPVINTPVDMFNVLNLLRPDVFSNFWSYAKKYCDAHRKKIWISRHKVRDIWVFGASNQDELKQLLQSTVMLRRLKKDVLQQLPEKRRVVVPVEIDNSEEYTEVKRDLADWLLDRVELGKMTAEAFESWSNGEGENVDMLRRVEALKQVAAKGKLSAAVEWIEDFLETGKKLIVFMSHKSVMSNVKVRFKDISVEISGDVVGDLRQKAIDTFQEDDKIKLMFATRASGGEGITLTAASDVLFLELGWTSVEHDQAESRAHRIGQRDAVTAWYMLGKGTIDEDIFEMINKKESIIKDTVGLGQVIVHMLKEDFLKKGSVQESVSRETL